MTSYESACGVICIGLAYTLLCFELLDEMRSLVAVDYVMDEMRKEGFENVHGENVTVGRKL